MNARDWRSWAVGLLLIGGWSAAGLELSPLYGDGMVMQRSKPLRIVGTATPGSEVTAELAGDSVETTTGSDGNFRLELPARPAGGPYRLTVREEGGKERIFHDVLIGDVWICSGQSNMEWPLVRSDDGEEAMAGPGTPELRFFQVPYRTSPDREMTTLSGGKWQKCVGRNSENLSGVGYFFAVRLQHDLDIPIGLIQSNWGGTAIESWLDRASLEALDCQPLLELVDTAGKLTEAEYQQFYDQSMQKWLRRIEREFAAERAAAVGWMAAELETGNWRDLTVPGIWERQMPAFDGVMWLRREVELPAGWTGRDLELSLGAVDDCDETYFNGVKVGATGVETPQYWAAKRFYRIPGELVRAGNNVIAIRIADLAYDGGLTGRPEEVFLQLSGDPAGRIELAGTWLARRECVFTADRIPARPVNPVDLRNQYFPTTLYNGMIRPLIDYPAAGFLWYQGESNVGNPALYSRSFPQLIERWRQLWGDGGMGFFFVQLSAFEKHEPGLVLPDDYFLSREPDTACDWAYLREAQDAALQLPLTGRAISIDLGNATDIHPTNKRDVGIRLALEAERVYYRLPVESRGPAVREIRPHHGELEVVFDHAGDGLVTGDGKMPANFLVAGADGKFRRAEAKISGHSVFVGHPDIKEPKFVRYAWENYPLRINLYNRAGLPAEPFRSDKL